MSNVIMSPYYCCVLVMFLVPCPVNGACAASDVWPVQTCTLLAVDLIFAHSKFIVPSMDGCYLKESNLQIQVRKELQNAVRFIWLVFAWPTLLCGCGFCTCNIK